MPRMQKIVERRVENTARRVSMLRSIRARKDLVAAYGFTFNGPFVGAGPVHLIPAKYHYRQ